MPAVPEEDAERGGRRRWTVRPIDADELLKQRYRMGFGQVSVVSVDAIEKAPPSPRRTNR